MLGPDVWGPHGWKFIHYITLAYPVNLTTEEKEQYKIFFHSIGNVLPCSICSNHYKKNLLEMPLTDEILSSKDNVINWAIDMHNKVNASRKKKIYSHAEARALIDNDEECSEIETPKDTDKKYVDTFTNIHKSETENKTTNMLYIGGIIFILIAIAIIYKKK